MRKLALGSGPTLFGAVLPSIQMRAYLPRLGRTATDLWLVRSWRMMPSFFKVFFLMSGRSWKCGKKKNTSPADVAKSLSIFSDAREVVEMSKKTQVPPM